MAFEIKKDEFDKANTHEKRRYINTPGEYVVEIEAAKVIKIKKLNNYKTGVVEFRIKEVIAGDVPVGTACNWMACSNPQYSSLQVSELKNFSQAALKAEAAKDGDVPAADELNDPGIINSIFVDADDHPADEAPDSLTKKLEMRIRFSEKTNKKGNTFVIGSWV